MKKTFEQYHADNPHVWQAFVHFSVQAKAKGFLHYGAKSIFEAIRFNTSERGKEPFKVNNIYTPDYARKMEKEYPSFEGFFEKRQLKKAVR